MKKSLVLAAALLIAPAFLGAQNVESVHLNAELSASKVTGGLETDAVGSVHMLLRVYRDGSGNAVKAFVDFKVKYWFGQEENISNMHVHAGADGANGGVVIPSNLVGPIVASGDGILFEQVVIDTPDGLESVEAVIANPAAYYVNVHTASNPPGIMRGQLAHTELTMAQAANARIADLEAQIETLTETVNRIARRVGVVPAE